MTGIASPPRGRQDQRRGDLVNLNKARKARAKNVAHATSAVNRVKFGRTKAEKDRERQEQVRADKLLDGAKLEKD